MTSHVKGSNLFVSSLSDDELIALKDRVGLHDFGKAMAAVAIVCPLGLVGLAWSVLVRAAERSSYFDIAVWCVLTAICAGGTFAALKAERRIKAANELWAQVIEEMRNRGL